MIIKIHNIDDLIFAEYNPRQLTKDQYQSLKDSIQRFGLVDPIIINSNDERKNIVVGGHQRLKIAKDLNIEKIPCVELDLTIQQEKELNVRLNKNTGEWDWDALANYFEIDSLFDWGFKQEEIFMDQDYGTAFELSNEEKEPIQKLTFTVADDQVETIQKAIKKAKKNDFSKLSNSNKNGNALWWICNHYE